MRYLFRNLLKDKTVEKIYLKVGGAFGCDSSDVATMGECTFFKIHLNRWGNWEKEYAKRGFRTISLDKFIDYGGYGKPITNLVGIKREKNENPVFHADLYAKHYLGKIKPVIDLEKMMKDGKSQSGTYINPSTEIFVTGK